MVMLGVSFLCQVAPRVVWKHRINTWPIETGEDEQQILPSLCSRGKISVDVGAADGTYSVRLLLYSSRVVAFEPNPRAFEELTKQFKDTRIISVENVALSDECGSVEMRVPVDRPMWGTIESTNLLTEASELNSVSVQRKRLDDYGLQAVGFIKIDVEGHEISVLNGARETIARERPKLLIEIDQSHLPQVCSFFTELRYAGFFFLDRELVPVERFNASIHQNPANLVRGRRVGLYINNFIFTPQSGQ
jgi:FkbM family methyltransferase